MIKQFMQNVFWEDTDYLIVDTPPGKIINIPPLFFNLFF